MKKAARIFNVPVMTLRDRVLGRIDPNCQTTGSPSLFDCDQERKLVDHFKKMASFGYGYTRQECCDIATDFAIELGVRAKTKPLTLKWFRGFIKRWPELKVQKPRGLEQTRAKCTSKEKVAEYMTNLQAVLESNNLMDKPHLIFNVDEKGISVDHKPPHVVSSSDTRPPAVTSGKGQTVTIIGGGSASGMQIPPFFVFPGKRMNPDLLQGASPGASGTVSETGWSNSAIFRQYLEDHFCKFIPTHADQKILLLMDGHKSHVSVFLSEWALSKGILLFVLPAHTSHALQTLDVSCYGPFERMYHNHCHKLIRRTGGAITKYNLCEIACKVYIRALSAENLQSGFKRTGVFPFNPSIIPLDLLLPAEVFHGENDNDISSSQSTVEGGVQIDMLDMKEMELKKTKSNNQSKSRDTMSKVVAGKALCDDVVEQMKSHEQRHKPVTKDQTHKKLSNKENVKPSKAVPKPKSPKPGPSAVNLLSDTDVSSDEEYDDSELCCVCKRHQPIEIARSVSLMFVKWVQCDGMRRGMPCKHWTHLGFCTTQKVIRKGVQFFCIHCQEE